MRKRYFVSVLLIVSILFLLPACTKKTTSIEKKFRFYESMEVDGYKNVHVEPPA
jgi:hypothetical protein